MDRVSESVGTTHLPTHMALLDQCVMCTFFFAVHAHMILWVHEADVAEASRSITAAVPGVFVPDAAGGHFQAAPNATARDKRLLQLVLAHQMHKCWQALCCKQGWCRDGFPFDTQMDRDPQWSDEKGRYTYYRPGHAHRNVSPYHPAMLLAWGAHLNLQRVAHKDWSYYLLKYAVKANFIGDVTTDLVVAHKIGLHNVSEEMLHLLSTLVLATPVSPCLAAAHMAGINTFTCSDAVSVIVTQPPVYRVRMMTRGNTLNIPHVDVYCARPTEHEGLTLYEYFTKFTVTKVCVR